MDRSQHRHYLLPIEAKGSSFEKRKKMMKQKVTKNGLVTMADVDFFGLSEEDGGKWVLMCETHNEFIQDTNKKTLWQHCNESQNWCQSCQTSFYAEKVGA